jgi:hypothetical protein
MRVQGSMPVPLVDRVRIELTYSRASTERLNRLSYRSIWHTVEDSNPAWLVLEAGL